MRTADARHPYDLKILGALVSMNRERGKPPDALFATERLSLLCPSNA